MTLVEWAEKISIHPHTLQKRLASGWSIEKALTTPLSESKSSKYRGDIEIREERKHE